MSSIFSSGGAHNLSPGEHRTFRLGSTGAFVCGVQKLSSGEHGTFRLGGHRTWNKKITQRHGNRNRRKPIPVSVCFFQFFVF